MKTRVSGAARIIHGVHHFPDMHTNTNTHNAYTKQSDNSCHHYICASSNCWARMRCAAHDGGHATAKRLGSDLRVIYRSALAVDADLV